MPRASSVLLRHFVLCSVFAAFVLFGPGPAAGEASPETSAVLTAATDTTDHQLAPDFTLKRMDGSTFRLSDHRGQVVVVNFWATWCPPCLEEIPGFVRLQEDLGPRGLVFVGVSTDDEGFDVVRPYAEKMDINYPLVVDDGTVAPQYGGIYALPMSFVIDAKGTVRYFQPGMLPEEALRPVLVRLLDEAADARGQSGAGQ